MSEVNWDAIIALAIPNLVGIAAAIPCIGQISNKEGTAWWQVIKKPKWVIAEWFFGPILAFILSSLGYASYLVYHASSKGKDTNELLPTLLYASLLILFLLGAVLLYKFHNYSLTFFNVLLANVVTLALTTVFYQINSASILFLIPIQAWQVYATFLDHALWVLNSPKADDCEILKA